MPLCPWHWPLQTESSTPGRGRMWPLRRSPWAETRSLSRTRLWVETSWWEISVKSSLDAVSKECLLGRAKHRPNASLDQDWGHLPRPRADQCLRPQGGQGSHKVVPAHSRKGLKCCEKCKLQNVKFLIRLMLNKEPDFQPPFRSLYSQTSLIWDQIE